MERTNSTSTISQRIWLPTITHRLSVFTGYIHVNDHEDEEDFDQKNKDRGFKDMDTKDQIADLNNRVGDVENLLGIDPDDDKTLDKVAKALDDAGYEKPEEEEEE